MKDKIFCCKQFKKQSKLKALSGGGIGYKGFTPESQIEYDKEKDVFHVKGCCGGGCFVLVNLIFCPWCGKKLSNKEMR